ncbi:hypothetical protein EJH27_01655 [Salmonella enterica subsp. enterica serovar Virchow]|nr:hypothetical protein [Salmonella enterica subsp. enterica serovar Virchow]
MTTTMAPTVAVTSDDDLPLSAHLTEPACSAAEPDDTPAQSAAHRLGGSGKERWQPATGGRSLTLNILTGAVILGLLGAVVFLWLTVRQQQIQLTTLDTAFRSGQLQSLPDRMLKIENQQAQFALKSQADKWQQHQAQQQGDLDELKIQFTTLTAAMKQAQSATSQVAEEQGSLGIKLDSLQKALDVQVLRIDTLTAWKDAWEKRSASHSARTVPAPGGSLPVVKKPPKPQRLNPPFTLVSTERRGGQAYAVILPQGTGGWSQLRMLSPGESVSGWTLVSVSGNQADFQVNGQSQRLTF